MADESTYDDDALAALAGWRAPGPERLFGEISADLGAVEHQIAGLAALAGSGAPGAVTPAWARTTIGEVAELGPRAPSRDELSDDTEVAFVEMAAVDAERGIILSTETRSAGEVRRGHPSFRDGDVLFAKITPSMENGKAAVARDLQAATGFGSTEFFVLRPAPGVLPEFLYYFLRRPVFRAAAAERMTGKAGQQRVPATYLRSVALPLATTGEQRRIVTHLVGVEDRYAELLPMLEAVGESLAEARRAALWHACLGGLDAPGASAAGPAAEELLEQIRAARLQEPRQGRPHPGFLDPAPPAGWDPRILPALPVGWTWTSVGFAASRMQYGTSTRSAADADTGIPNIGMQNIQDGRLDLRSVRHVALDEDRRDAFLLSQGDVLFNRTNSPELVGKAAVFDRSVTAVFASYLIRVAVDERVADPRFVAHWINSPWGRTWAAAVKKDALSQSNINMRKLAALPLPWAPVEQQRAICDALDVLLAQGDALEEQIDEQGRVAEQLRWTIVDAAFAGTLRMPGDPIADKGPQALLEVVRAQAEEPSVRVDPRPRPAPAARPVGLAATVETFGDATFTFEDLLDSTGLKYEALVEALTAALTAETPPLCQVFDREERRVRFRRRPL